MKVRFVEVNSNHSGPVIEIISENDSDVSELGILLRKLPKNENIRIWPLFAGGIMLELPLVNLTLQQLERLFPLTNGADAVSVVCALCWRMQLPNSQEEHYD